jgi:hypothetical protein
MSPASNVLSRGEPRGGGVRCFVPSAFPPHQGLILPLWQRFPSRFHGLSLAVGAAAPDLVDGVAFFYRGELGQWLGHSLVGLPLLCLPLSLLLLPLVRRATRSLAWAKRLDLRGGPHSPGSRATSVLIGAASHDFFDLITHANFPLLLPWREGLAFPAWWTHSWAEVDLRVYEAPYPIAPHFISWAIFSLLGIALFVQAVRGRG